MDKKRIVCFGDSNTWGYIPKTKHNRYDENTRWTKLLAKSLPEVEVIEEGLCSRTLCSFDPRVGKEGKRGWDYLKPCLETHDKIDLLILSLGTNDLADWYDHTVEDVFEMFVKYVDFIHSFENWDGSKIELIVLGLPPIDKDKVANDVKFSKAPDKCLKLIGYLENYCRDNDIPYVDNSDLTVGGDGVHLTKESHKALADRLTKAGEALI